VLSGFLITFLLIREKEMKQDISLAKFYIRRILRIWPLFYVCLLLGFVGFPLFKYNSFSHPHELSNGWYYLFFSGNFDFIKIWPQLPDALTLVVLWSVAVEEQFYLTWPILLKFFKKIQYPAVFMVVIIGTLIFRSFFTTASDADYAIRNFHTFSVIGDMALGGLMAYYCSYQSKLFIRIVQAPRWLIIALYLLTIAILLFKNALFIHPVALVTERVILALLFACIIAEQNFAKNSFFKFSTCKVISKLGVYTYGLYCLHFFGILGVQAILDKTHIPVGSIFANLAAVMAALLITIGISMFSYQFFEKWFLTWKEKFAFITKK
jgi:peptidoglycan/LPS O-acetylase OafA/YrhL